MSSGPLVATFLPELGMLGVSLRHRGEELLALPGGLDGYRAGAVTGLPLLAPWANRLGERRYEVEGVVVDLEGLALHTDDQVSPSTARCPPSPAGRSSSGPSPRSRRGSTSARTPSSSPRSPSLTSSGSR